MKRLLPGLFMAAMCILPLHAQIMEDFDSLDRWEPLTFRNIEALSRYEAGIEDGKTVLHCRADSSASGLIYRGRFRVAETPIVEWSWKIDGTVPGGNALKKAGDDYAVRIYVIFPYDPERVSGFDRLKYAAAKRLYGEYPPLSSLNYIWANRRHDRAIIPNPFTSRAMMIPMDSGEELAGEWRVHSVDIREDYRRAFGEEAPAEASIAVMCDTDNTGTSAEAFIDYIRVRGP